MRRARDGLGEDLERVQEEALQVEGRDGCRRARRRERKGREAGERASASRPSTRQAQPMMSEERARRTADPTLVGLHRADERLDVVGELRRRREVAAARGEREGSDERACTSRRQHCSRGARGPEKRERRTTCDGPEVVEEAGEEADLERRACEGAASVRLERCARAQGRDKDAPLSSYTLATMAFAAAAHFWKLESCSPTSGARQNGSWRRIERTCRIVKTRNGVFSMPACEA